MKLYTSCFIGIPLSPDLSSQYRELQQQLHTTLPELDLANPLTPHMTLYYLDSQKEDSLEQIMQIASEYIDLLRAETLHIKGFDYFRPHDPRVLFLQVAHSPRVEQYYRVLCEALSSFRREQETRDFHAHLTLGRVRDDSARDAFVRKESEVRNIVENYAWSMKIDEICLWGVDSTHSNDGQSVILRYGM